MSATATAQDLFSAISSDDADEVHNALNAGADINARDTIGFTPLQNAILHGKNDAVAVLLERGADPEVPTATGSGYTAVHCAAQGKNEAAMKLLLQYHAELNKLDEAGETPLHVAAVKGALAIAKLLVEAGAEVNPQDKNKETPRDVAERIASQTTTTGVEPHFDTARFLQKAEEERGIDRASEQARRELVERDVAVLKSYHPEHFKIKPKLTL
ncbi:MAG: ankyrin repeat domain-containing protein [Alphaproteobacteria bacterium]|nr:MAG: ankyrin repeat domain-containing protein [Alphaproteobacteria bacterium]